MRILIVFAVLLAAGGCADVELAPTPTASPATPTRTVAQASPVLVELPTVSPTLLVTSGATFAVEAEPVLPPAVTDPPTAVPPPAPTEAPYVPPVVEPPASWEAGSVQAQFFEGYRAAGGYYAESHISRVIACESNWNPYAGGYVHLGLAQFAPGTWESAGGGDWTNPHQQGANMARWIAAVEAEGGHPGTSIGWPYCWWR